MKDDGITTRMHCSTENDPVKIYYSDLEPLCTENGLDSMSANRIPFEYEELAEKYGYTLNLKIFQ